MQVTFMTELTEIIRESHEKVKEILSSSMDISLKTTLLRKMAREIAEQFKGQFGFKDIDEFKESYDRGNSPLIRLEGEGIRHEDLIILKDCPMVPVFEYFKDGDKYPDYWSRTPEEYMSVFKNEAILHPLCIVHQRCRDELASRIPKGETFVHSIAVACRSTSTGKIVYSRFGLQMASVTEDEIKKMIDGYACAFLIK